ncbi:MAG: DUF1269 domain-containing protein [Acidimicrobiia bacterium]|nr:DUF1269 domain-containing protein [Acidimicrobiia bacterium]MDH5616146.1 DUF1269 domain-containing protein [Acidimicrobiia bacterium]
MTIDKGFPFQPSETSTAEAHDVLAIDFDDELKAREALLAATRLGRRHSVEMTDAAIVTRTPTGRTKILQTRDISTVQGAVNGSWWGGLAGLVVAGITGWAIGLALGAIAGGLWAKLRDIGINDPWMRRTAANLAPGHAAAFFQLPHVYATHLIRELRRFDGKLLHNSLRDVDTIELEEALAIVP